MKPGIFLVVRRSLRQHAVSTTVSVISVALAVALLISITILQKSAYRAFSSDSIAFDAVLGARGSSLQLVLNAIFHLETSPGNIPWSLYQALQSDRRVKTAIPYAVGDNYRGFRIVGTSEKVFEHLEAGFAEGRVFDTLAHEAVIGANVAAKTGLTVGSVFKPYHGVYFNENSQHQDEYVVAGVLDPTNTPTDRVVWIPIEGIFRMGGHVLRGTGKEFKPESTAVIPDEHKEVSAVMLKLRGPADGLSLDREINKQGKVATLAWPIGSVMADLFSKLGWGVRLLTVVAVLVGIVAAAGVMGSIYNTIRERRREFAILRALGARKRTIFGIVVTESMLISGLGSLLGIPIHIAILTAASSVIRSETGVMIDPLVYHPALIVVPVGMVLLGAIAGIVPAIRAYSTDVASSLVPHS